VVWCSVGCAYRDGAHQIRDTRAPTTSNLCARCLLLETSQGSTGSTIHARKQRDSLSDLVRLASRGVYDKAVDNGGVPPCSCIWRVVGVCANPQVGIKIPGTLHQATKKYIFSFHGSLEGVALCITQIVLRVKLVADSAEEIASQHRRIGRE
jgi:hypothetical protein